MTGICRVGVDFVGDPSVHGDLLGLHNSNVFVNGKPIAVLSDNIKPHKPFTGKHNAAKTQAGSPTVFVNGKAVFRKGDAADCGHVATTGSENVFAN